MNQKHRKSPMTALRRLLEADESSRLDRAEDFLVVLSDEHWEAYRALTHLQLESVLANFRHMARKKGLQDIERSADTMLKFMARYPDGLSKTLLAAGRDPEAIQREAWSLMGDLARKNYPFACAVAQVAIQWVIDGATQKGFTKVAELFRQLENPAMWDEAPRRAQKQEWVQ